MNTCKNYKKRNAGGYYVYEVTKKYDKRTKNSKLVKSVYLGIAEEKGATPKRARTLEIKKIYNYGFVNYLNEMVIKKKIGERILNQLNEDEKNILLLFTYYFIETKADFQFLNLWLDNQWMAKEFELTKIDEQALTQTFISIGETINLSYKEEIAEIEAKESINYSIESTIKRLPEAFRNSNVGVSQKLIKFINISQIFFIDTNSPKITYIPVRQSYTEHIALLKNINLTKVYGVDEDNSDVVLSKIKSRKRQQFICIVNDKQSSDFESIPSIQKIKLQWYNILHTTDYDDKQLSELISKIDFLKTEFSIFEKSFRRLLSFSVTEEEAYPFTLGVYVVFLIILEIKLHIYTEEKNKLSNYSYLDNFLTEKIISFQGEMLVEYEDGSTEVMR